MERLEQFEYLLPKIKIDIDNIYIETSGGFEGNFVIKNTGGSELCGTITSNSGSIIFSPSEFRGNSVEVTYSLNLDSFKQGDILKRSVLIISNGGEAVIPVTIKIVPPAINSKEGYKIASLNDFYEYSEINPIGSRQMFNQWDFSVWLSGLGYEYVQLYEHFVSDPNKERAVDNFLVMNKLKEKSVIRIDTKMVCLKITASPESKSGILSFSRSCPGYVDAWLTIKTGASWFKPSKGRLTGADFGSGNTAQIPFKVDVDFLSKRVNFAQIDIETESEKIGSLTVQAVKAQSVSSELNTSFYEPDDEGFVKITNNSGKDIMIEITAKDNYVKFEGRKYFVGSYAEIPFTVKFTSFQIAQAVLKKQPVYVTEINVKAATGDTPYRQTLNLSVGGF